MIRAVLFDIDGTLIDSNELHVEAWHQVFSDAGHRIEEAKIRGQIGKGGDNLVPALLPDLPDAEQKALADDHGRVFKQQFLSRAKPFEAASQLLRHVHATGRKVVLASSASEEELKHYVQLLGVEDIVDAFTSIDDVETSKPAPDIFTVALGRAKVMPEEAVAVGDTPYDVEAAGQAGVGTVALLSGGFSPSALQEAGADTIYANVADLLTHFDESPLAR